jgi:phosphatidylinositol alpha-mannosyltransferase
MRIALVTEYYRPTIGGVQEHVFHFAREARLLGHDVSVITSRVPDLPVPQDDRHVSRVGTSLRVEANGSVGRVTVGAEVGRELRRLLVKDRFDVVHVHAPLSPVLPVLAIRATSLPVVGTFHTNFPKSRLLSLLRRPAQRLVEAMAANVAVSEVCIRALRPYVDAPFRIIPNGVDCRHFASGRRLASVPEDRPAVLFIGRLEPRSGHDRLLAAWPAVARVHDAELLVIGDGPERVRYEALALAAGGRVRFVGARHADRPDFLATAQLLVCPTTIASFGITLLEGMAAGVPVVASDIDGFREVLTSGREGLLVDTARPPALAEAVNSLLADPRRRDELGAEGRRTAARYDWPLVAARVLSLYRQVGAET